jgi:hypothetical protein
MSSAGIFRIKVSSPYPVWCHLTVEGVEVKRQFSHRDLSDLLYCVQKAMHEARLALPESDRHEVGV